ncbi:MAG: hypothetical protein U0X91_32180 [Spirosomataceae bacterium]
MPKLPLLRYKDLENDALSLRSLTGLNKKDFEKLHRFFEKELQNYFVQFTLNGVPRTRRLFSRRNSLFSDTGDALLFILIYLNGSVRQNELAELFGIDQPKVSKYVNFLGPILSQVINNHARAMSRSKKERILTKRLYDKSRTDFDDFTADKRESASDRSRD